MAGVTFATGCYRNAHLIYNPSAGKLRRNPQLIDAIQAALGSEAGGVTVRATQAPGEAGFLSLESVAQGADVVIACGGDGTINEVLQGLVNTDVPMAILPAGTANVLAMETRLGSDPVAAAAKLASLEPARISVGKLQGTNGTLPRYFIALAGAGFDAYIVSRLDTATKNTLGKAAYWLAGFQRVGKRLEEINVVADGTVYRCSFALASRVRNYGGDLEIAIGASLLADDIEVVLFEGTHAFQYLPYLAGVLTKTLASMPGITVLRARQLTLSPTNGKPVLLHLDGEECGTLPATLELVPRAVTMLLPPDYLAQERQRWTT